jgi:hypothetical protein
MSFTQRLTRGSLLAAVPFASFIPKSRAARRIEPAFDNGRIAGTHPTPGMPDMSRLLAAARKPPQLALIEWDGDGAATAASNDERADDPRSLDGARRRIRDRYIGARFPGVARSAAELACASRVVKAARLYFEEEDVASALELLQLAVEEAPHDSALWLARLEILFLTGDAAGFTALAREFGQAHPQHPEWGEVIRLGRALAPTEALFAAGRGAREHEHYGPWPDLPNWIQAPWDLTAEVLAADFHRAMDRERTVRALVPLAA